MLERPRSDCPISLALEILGDRWSLLILRDMMFAGKRHFREFLRSGEGISTRVLSDRLSALVAEGILTKRDHPTHRQKAIYSLTEKGLRLLPVIAQLGIWGSEHCLVTDESAAIPRALEAGGIEAIRRKMTQLRADHGLS